MTERVCTCSGDEMALVSLFDGIAGFPRAFATAGMRTVATVEIDKAAAGVAADHFPEAKAFTDVTEVTPDELLAAGFCPVHGVLTAGWPCTDLSLAGLRLGLGGARSGLVGEVFRLLLGLRPGWFVLENVPGLLSSVCPCPGGGICSAAACAAGPHSVRGGACGRARGGRQLAGPGRCMALHGGGMGTVVRRLGECGYGIAYRVLDAQHFGVPQRRRRVVIVGRLGDAAGPAEVLLEPESGAGNPAAGGAARKGTARRAGRDALGAGAAVNALTRNMAGGGGGVDDNTAQGGHLVAMNALTSHHGRLDPNEGGLITHALTAERADASEDGTGRGTPPAVMPTLTASMGSNNAAPGNGGKDEMVVPVGFNEALGNAAYGDMSPTVRAGTGGSATAVAAAAVRRLTPVECERLQGYPDGWTATSYGKAQSDSARYRQLGNSIAGPVFEWVARRLVAVERGESL